VGQDFRLFPPPQPVNARVIVLQQKCIEPLGKSKSDYQIFTLLSDPLGIKEQFTEGRDEIQWVKRMYEVSDLPKVMNWKEFQTKVIISCR